MSGVRYELRVADAHAHRFEVRVEIDGAVAARGVDLRFPAWIPGSYMVRDFARHVIAARAEAAPPADAAADAAATGAAAPAAASRSEAEGAPSAGSPGPGSGSDTAVAIAKTDKSTWRCVPWDGALRVVFDIYAFDLSVRGAWLDQTRGYFNGVCLFPAVLGHEQEPLSLRLVRPGGQAGLGWRVATSLRPGEVDGAGFGDYLADDYADLIDHPVEMSDHEVERFDVAGVPHRLVLSGRQRCDIVRLTNDLTAICHEHHALFGTPADLDRYAFLVHVADRAGGGLEHRFSNSCIVARDMLPRPGTAADDRRYARLLALLSHEYFHLWHVKRTVPAAFQPMDLAGEQYTRTLWVFEGITSYYDMLALVRSGVASESTYLALLSDRISTVLHTPGRHRQSIAESSFDAWIKLYKRDENAHNAIVSYYSKGSLVALALDLTIRRDTGGTHSLDDVMRELWRRHGATGEGLEERGLEALAQEVTGLDLADFFARTVDGTADPALADLLGAAGIDLRQQVPEVKAGAAEWYLPGLGAGCRRAGEQVVVSYVTEGGSAHAAGLAAGDTLLALDGIRLDAGNAVSRLEDTRPGESGSLHAFRRDELMQFDITFAAPAATAVRLVVDEEAPAAAHALRAAWLRSAGDTP